MTDTLGYTVESGYIEVPFTTDPDSIYANALAEISAELPGWIPKEGHIEVLLLEQFAAMAAISAQVAATMPLAAFSFYGGLIGILPEQGTPATAQSTWTMVDTQGYTVPAGTIVGYQVSGTNLIQFQTVDSFTIPSGSIQTDPGAVLIEAVTVGSSGNGLAAQNLALVQPNYVFVSSIASTSVSSGGVDPETTTQYMDRLSDELQLLSPRPILPNDFALLAQNIPGVYRAAAYNGVNPYGNILSVADSTLPNTGGVTWAAVANCTASPDGDNELLIVTTASGTASVRTGSYPISPGATYQFFYSTGLATSGAATSVQAIVRFFDVNGNGISLAEEDGGIPDSMAAAPIDHDWTFTAPANAVTCTFEVDYTGILSGQHHILQWPSVYQGSAPTNIIPNSSMLLFTPGPSSDWGYGSVPFATNVNAFQVIGTGSSQTNAVESDFFYAPASVYTFSCYIDASNVTSGTVEANILVGGSDFETLTQDAGVSGVVSSTFTLGGATQFQIALQTNGATVEVDQTLTFAMPQLTAGSSVQTYTEGPTFSPPDELINQERTVTVACVDEDGDALSAELSAQVESYLESQREVNFIVNVIAPSYNPIDVNWVGTCDPNADVDATRTLANATISSYLSAANSGGGSATPPYWDPTQTTIHYLSVVTILGDVPGIAYLESVTIGFHNQDTLGTVDLDMIGIAPLPQAGTINGSLT